MGHWIRPVMMCIWLVLGVVLWFQPTGDGSPLFLPLGHHPAWFAFLLALWNAFRWYQFINQRKRNRD